MIEAVKLKKHISSLEHFGYDADLKVLYFRMEVYA